jgi:hypothetical protein
MTIQAMISRDTFVPFALTAAFVANGVRGS